MCVPVGLITARPIFPNLLWLVLTLLECGSLVPHILLLRTDSLHLLLPHQQILYLTGNEMYKVSQQTYHFWYQFLCDDVWVLKSRSKAEIKYIFSLTLCSITVINVCCVVIITECKSSYFYFFSASLYLFSSLSSCHSQGLDEEAIVDHGKTSFTTHTNYENEDLESKYNAKIFLVTMCFFKRWEG